MFARLLQDYTIPANKRFRVSEYIEYITFISFSHTNYEIVADGEVIDGVIANKEIDFTKSSKHKGIQRLEIVNTSASEELVISLDFGTAEIKTIGTSISGNVAIIQGSGYTQLISGTDFTVNSTASKVVDANSIEGYRNIQNNSSENIYIGDSTNCTWKILPSGEKYMSTNKALYMKSESTDNLSDIVIEKG